MITFYGSHICGNCRDALDYLEEQKIPYRFIEITESTDSLREFLKLRDSHPLFSEIKKEGRIGIPCFIRPDGIPSLSLEEALREESRVCEEANV